MAFRAWALLALTAPAVNAAPTVDVAEEAP